MDRQLGNGRDPISAIFPRKTRDERRLVTVRQSLTGERLSGERRAYHRSRRQRRTVIPAEETSMRIAPS
jgi:hypothetical protein